jgi:hypothetical protein
MLKPNHAELASEIQDFVRTRLAAREYPRLTELVDTLAVRCPRR